MMKPRSFAPAVAALLVLCFTANARAQTAPPAAATAPTAPPAAKPGAFGAQFAAPSSGKVPAPTIGVVDSEAVLREATASKGLMEQYQKQRSSFASEMSKRDNDLRNAKAELDKQRTGGGLSVDSAAEKQRDLEVQLANFKRDAEAKQRQLEEAFNQSNRQVEQAVGQILTQVAQERGVNLILPKNVTFLSAPDLDLTREVIARLDKQLPSVKVSVPGSKS